MRKGLYYISISVDIPPFVSGDIIRVYYDDVADTIVVTRNGADITSGPDLGPQSGLVVPPFGQPYVAIFWWKYNMNDAGGIDFLSPSYSFCEALRLVDFMTQVSYFPYAVKSYTEDAPQCAGNVCDIIFRGTPQLVKPTDTVTADGQITILAESSLGTVKYDFSDKPYADMSNATGVFNGLLAGTYTIYAKDPNGCAVQLTVALSAAFNYGIKYRMEYDDHNGNNTRIDILEKDYTGDINEVCGTDTPLTIRFRGENSDFFKPVVDTGAVVGLLSETNQQFLPLFTQSDRKYQKRFYKDIGSGYVEKWRGWIVTGLYNEQYVRETNYYTSCEFNDNLVTLKDIPFLDDSGNKITGRIRLIRIIAIILGKTDLELPILSGCNIFPRIEGSEIQVNNDDMASADWVNDGRPGEAWSDLGLNAAVDIAASPGNSQEYSEDVPVHTFTGRYGIQWNGLAFSSGSHAASITIAVYDELGITNLFFTTKSITEADYFLDEVVEFETDEIIGRIGVYVTLASGADLHVEISSVKLNTLSAITETDDPLDMVYIDAGKTYYKTDGTPMSCLDVLSNIMTAFGARLFQWEGHWRILRIDEQDDVYDYRVFDTDGNYVSNGSANPMSDLLGPVDFESNDCSIWCDASQQLEVQKAISKSNVTFELRKLAGGIKNGSFDEILLPPSLPGLVQGYPGWGIVLNGNVANWPYITSNAAITSSLIIGKDENKYALCFVSSGGSGDFAQEAYVQSDNQPIRFNSNDAAIFSFDYYPLGLDTSQIDPAFIKFRFSFTLTIVGTTYYLQADGGWSTDVAFEWVDVNVTKDKFDQWNTVQIGAFMPAGITTEEEGTFTVRLMYGRLPVIGDEDDLRAVPTVQLPEGFKLTTKEIAGMTTIYRFYELVSSLAADSSPQTIRPDDYGAFDPPAYSSLTTYNKNDKVKDGGNYYVSTVDNNIGNTPSAGTYWAQIAGVVLWNMVEETVLGILETPGYYGMRLVEVKKFDNVNFRFLPDGNQPPETKTYTVDNTDEFNEEKSVSVVNGDVPFDIRNAENIYQNYFTFSDGTPTKFWTRVGISEQGPLLALLTKQHVEQFSGPKINLNGNLLSSKFLDFNKTIVENNKMYLPTYLQLDDKRSKTSVNMTQLTEVNDGTLNPFGPGEFATAEFGKEYDI